MALGLEQNKIIIRVGSGETIISTSLGISHKRHYNAHPKVHSIIPYSSSNDQEFRVFWPKTSSWSNSSISPTHYWRSFLSLSLTLRSPGLSIACPIHILLLLLFRGGNDMERVFLSIPLVVAGWFVSGPIQRWHLCHWKSRCIARL